MGKALNFAGGVGLGALGMYYFDPNRGHSRRAYLRDQVFHYLRIARRDVQIASIDLAHRTQGVVAEAKSRLIHLEVPDHVLVERIRSKLGRIITHPKKIDLHADQGHVTVRGEVHLSDIESIISQIHSVQGVMSIVNELKTLVEEGQPVEVPGQRQSGISRGDRVFPLRSVRTPGAQLLLTSLAGSALSWYAFKRSKAG